MVRLILIPDQSNRSNEQQETKLSKIRWTDQDKIETDLKVNEDQ